MTLTKANAIVALSKELDDYWASVASGNGDSAGSYLVDSALAEKVPEWIGDYSMVYLPLGPSGAGSAQTRQIDKLDNTFRLYPKIAFSAQVVATAAYEIHNLFSRSRKDLALEEALPLAFPHIHSVVRDTSIVIVSNQYEYDISSLEIYRNRPHQVLADTAMVYDTWVKETAYEEDDIVKPTTFNGYVYKCTVAGTSDATEPTWPTTLNDTVVDGTATWTCYDTDYRTYPARILHDWEITPDGKLLINTNAKLTAGYRLHIVGIKPLEWNESDELDITTPHDKILYAQAAVYLCESILHTAAMRNMERWNSLLQLWKTKLQDYITKYSMPMPDGTIIWTGENIL